jgi:hypothetical protein
MIRRVSMLIFAIALLMGGVGDLATKEVRAQCGCSCAMVCDSRCEFACEGCDLAQEVSAVSACCASARRENSNPGPCGLM